MKKFLAIALALVVLASLAACTGGNKVEPYEGDLSTVIGKMYETVSPEFPTMDSTPVDLTDIWAVNGYLGLGTIEEAENATAGNVADLGIKEAFFSESMMMSHAYSLVVARVSDTSKVEEIKTAMFEGINQSKWVCVTADQLRVVSCADIVMLVMVSSELGPVGLADSLVQAFAATVSGAQVTGGNALESLSGEILSRG